MVRCAICGIRGQWKGDIVVSVGENPRWCSARKGMSASTVGRLRAHGPWLPDDEITNDYLELTKEACDAPVA